MSMESDAWSLSWGLVFCPQVAEEERLGAVGLEGSSPQSRSQDTLNQVNAHR